MNAGEFSSPIDSAYQSLSELPEDTAKVNALVKLTQTYYRMDPAKVRPYALEGLELAKQLNYTRGRAKSYGNLGIIDIMLDDYDGALDYQFKALEDFKTLKDNKGEVKTLCYIGVAYQMTAQFNEAFNFYVKALQRNQLGTFNEQTGIIYGNLGNLYEVRDQPDSALAQYNKALKIFLELKDSTLISGVYSNRGLLFHKLDKYQKALESFERSYYIDSLLLHHFNLSANLANRANVYLDLGKYDTAWNFFNRALRMDTQLENPDGIAFDYTGMSDVLFQYVEDSMPNEAKSAIFQNTEKELLENSLHYGLKAEEILDTLENNQYLIYRQLSEVSHRLGNLSDAFKYMDMYWTTREKVNSQDKIKRFVQAQAQREKEVDEATIRALKAERELQNYQLFFTVICLILTLIVILLLVIRLREKRKANKALVELNQALEDADKAKDKFFSIVAHELINPIGGLYSAMKIYSRELPHMEENESKEYLDSLLSSSKKASDLLVNLLEWGRVQRGQISFNPKKLDLSESIVTSIELLKNNAKLKNIEIVEQYSQDLMVTFDKQMIETALSNVILNAIKFTPAGGQITISTTDSKKGVEIVVEDNGVGISEDRIATLFDIAYHSSTPGTQREKGTGLGLILCKEFITKHGGDLQVKSTKGKGTTVSISLPK